MGQVLIDVVIEGTTPLLMNKYTDASQQNPGHTGTMKGDKGTPKEQAEAKLYRGIKGGIILPQPNLYRCLIDAGIFFKQGKRQLTTGKSSLLPACIEIEGIELPLISREGWTVDTRAVCSPSTGGRMLCHRPVFNDWKIEITLSVDTDMISVKLVRELVDAAGKRIGLGDFRPARKGPFGKYVVTSWKERAQRIAA